MMKMFCLEIQFTSLRIEKARHFFHNDDAL